MSFGEWAVHAAGRAQSYTGLVAYMPIFRLLDGGNRQTLRFAALVSCLAGLANAALLTLVNEAAETAAMSEAVSTESLLLYILTFAFFFIADRASLREANRFAQQRLNELRVRVAGKISSASLRTVENLGFGNLYATLGNEIAQLEQMFPLIVNAAQSLLLLAFCLLYIAILSWMSFVVIAGVIGVGLLLFFWRRRRLNVMMRDVYQRETEVLDAIGQFTLGFQEVRLNANRSDALFRHFTLLIASLKERIVGVSHGWTTLIQFSNAFLYLLLGTVVFILPMFFEGYTDTIYKIAGAAIFCVGPVTVVTSVAHLYAKAELGLSHVYELEERLDSHLSGEQDRPAAFDTGFTTITYRDICFTYRQPDGTPGFTSGPWSFSLKRGEAVFITGANGGGKSTIVKLLSGLYIPDSGTIEVDGVAVTPGRNPAFRQLFAAIFPNFHLFEKLYGLEHVDAAEVRRLIARMGLTGKVDFVNGSFTTRKLSSGQRKRMAMIVALLEDRPVYIFDEWAADQDAHFRDVFYHEIIPGLRARGKTVIVVTHDDRYWQIGDRCVVINDGRIRAAEETA